MSLAKRLPRVSDRIICTTICKALSETRFFTRVHNRYSSQRMLLHMTTWRKERLLVEKNAYIESRGNDSKTSKLPILLIPDESVRGLHLRETTCLGTKFRKTRNLFSF